MSTLDLSNHGTCPQQFRFDVEYPKQTLTGLGFWSYEGLRTYLITGSRHNIFLQGNLQYALQNNKAEYVYVADLQKQLLDTLKVELAKYPFLKLKYGKHTEVIWSKYGISPAEAEWVEVVRKALAN